MPPPSVQKNEGDSKFLLTLVGIYQIKQHYIPKDCNLGFYYPANPK